MGKYAKRLLCVLLTAVLLAATQFTAFVSAEALTDAANCRVSVQYVTLPMLDRQTYLDEDSAAQYLCQKMQQREATIVVYVRSEDQDARGLFQRIMEQACVHKNDSTAGDYLYWNRMGYGGNIVREQSGGIYHYQLIYDVDYYTTAQQEARLSQEVNALLAELDLEDKTDYQKVRGVYDYMTREITYDYDNLNNEAYKLKFSAYAALVNKTAVCQGYANLFYRLMLELGVDCRIITGSGNGGAHAWNIVKLDGQYYNVDATWDANWAQAGHDYQFFLRCEASFKDHIRQREYDTDEFHARYPMSSVDYVPMLSPQFKPGDTDGNGEVTGRDATLLLQCVANWNVEVDALAADVDGNGKVNGKDATLLLQYTAGWNVTLGTTS